MEENDELQSVTADSATTITNNSTFSPVTYMGPVEAAFATLIWTIIILTASIGNIMVIVAIFTYPALYIVQNFLLVSLAVADILVALLVMPFSITTTLMGYWFFGPEFCLFNVTCDVMLCTASILHLVAIALDRFFAIHYPIKYAQTRNLALVLGMIAAAWIISAIISIPPLVGWNDMDPDPNGCGYVQEKGYIIYSSMGSFYIPLVILVGVYITIFISARRRLRRRAQVAGPAYTAASAPTTPQVDAASADSPDKSDHQSLSATVILTPATASFSTDASLSPAQIRQHVAAEHKRLHRKLLIFPIQKRCHACSRAQNRLHKENSLVTSSFQVVEEDELSTLSPIVDLTVSEMKNQSKTQHHSHSHSQPQPQSPPQSVQPSPKFHPPSPSPYISLKKTKEQQLQQNDVSEDSLTPTTPATEDLPQSFLNGSAGKRPNNEPPTTPTRLFVPKSIRPKTAANAKKDVEKLPVKSANLNVNVNGKGNEKKIQPANSTLTVKQNIAQRQKISLTKERRAARTLLIVVLVFIICWLPFFIWYVIKPFCPSCHLDERFSNFFLWLGFLNSSLNPVIYTIFNLDFRKAFKRIFKRIFPSRK